jgi:RNA polymerase sigma-70 factor (ECF subfamily)
MSARLMAPPPPDLNAEARTPARGSARRDSRATEALIARRPEAIALVMEAHGQVLLGFLEGLLRDRARAEDVLQQVLLELWERGPTYDPDRAGLLTWALTIARSRALDELRRRVPEPLDPATMSERLGAEDHQADRLLEQWRLAGMLERLPRDEATLLRMRFYEGLSQSEISAQTAIPSGTVKTRMVNGLRHLRDLLEREEAGA